MPGTSLCIVCRRSKLECRIILQSVARDSFFQVTFLSEKLAFCVLYLRSWRKSFCPFSLLSHPVQGINCLWCSLNSEVFRTCCVTVAVFMYQVRVMYWSNINSITYQPIQKPFRDPEMAPETTITAVPAACLINRLRAQLAPSNTGSIMLGRCRTYGGIVIREL